MEVTTMTKISTSTAVPRFGAAAILAIALAAASAATLAAQPAGGSPSPAAGRWAAGADMGFTNRTGDDDLDADPFVGANLEYFVDGHVSIRGALSWHAIEGPTLPPPFRGNRDLDVISVTGNALYHWSGRAALPFVTAGAGIYSYDPELGDDDVELGLNFGGGVEVFTAPTVSIKFEALYHGTTADEPDSFVTGTGGVLVHW